MDPDGALPGVKGVPFDRENIEKAKAGSEVAIEASLIASNILDPTPFSDLNEVRKAYENGDWIGIPINAAGLLPGLGEGFEQVVKGGRRWIHKGGDDLADGALDCSEAVSDEIAQIFRNRGQGKLGEDEIRRRIEESDIMGLVGEQIRINTPGVGSHRVVDFLVENKRTGKLYVIEAKSGNATRDAVQIAKDKLIADPNVLTTFSGRKARGSKYEYPNGTPTGSITTIEVNASRLNK